MNYATRRSFLRRSAAASVACVGASLGVAPWSRARGANDDIRFGVVGVGSRVKIGGMGADEIRSFRKIPGVRVVALCDVDSANLGPEVENFEKRKEKVAAYADVRKLLENKDVDAIVVTTPNHWHALVTIWACQAGKDVYVQKPASHNIFEGRKMVEAARKYHRIVQCPNGSRAPNGYAEAVDFVRQGRLGKILMIRHVHFSPRSSIGKVSGPQPIPATLNYDLWSGPAPIAPLAAPEPALRLALAMALRRRRAGQLGHPSSGWLPHVRGRWAAPPRHQHWRTVRLRGRRPDTQHPDHLLRLRAGPGALRVPRPAEGQVLPDERQSRQGLLGPERHGRLLWESRSARSFTANTATWSAPSRATRPSTAAASKSGIRTRHPRSEPELHPGRAQPPRERSGGRYPGRAPLGRPGPHGQHLASRRQDDAGRTRSGSASQATRSWRPPTSGSRPIWRPTESTLTRRPPLWGRCSRWTRTQSDSPANSARRRTSSCLGSIARRS